MFYNVLFVAKFLSQVVSRENNMCSKFNMYFLTDQYSQHNDFYGNTIRYKCSTLMPHDVRMIFAFDAARFWNNFIPCMSRF